MPKKVLLVLTLACVGCLPRAQKLASPPPHDVLPEPTPGIPRVARIADYGMKGTLGVKTIPEGLRYTDAEAAAIVAARRAAWAKLGYAPRWNYYTTGGHAYSRWTKTDIWEKHRDWFGLTAYGTRGVEMPGFPAWMKSLSKMCVSNEEVVDAKVAEWKKWGCPEYIAVGENDGLVGYCRCANCRALDADLPGERFLVNKTDRYLNFWNRLAAKMRAIRPDVKVCMFLYSILRHPPRREKVAFPDNMLFSYVPSYNDPDPAAEIRAWQKAGLKNFYLRPNWLCSRTALPIAREKYLCDVHHALRRRGSLGDNFDSTLGVKATEFEYYAALRLCIDPDATFERIAADWYARFGAARDVARAYYERVRARCDRGWARLLAQMAAEGTEVLDDSHFSRRVHEFHTVQDFAGDLALLEAFNAASLAGEAKTNLENLKLATRHYALLRQALETKSDADKKALTDFRLAHRDALGSAWTAHRNKGEFWLWDDSKAKRDYENTGLTRIVEDLETHMGAMK